jgi:hypothetical protein
MDGINTALSVLSLVIIALVVERVMSVFFEKRKTSIFVFVLSYLFFIAVLGLHFHEVVDVLLHFIALTVISLNYKSVAMKRVAAVAGGHYILIATTEIHTVLIRFFPESWIISNQVIAILVTSLLIYLVALTIFPLFRHIKKPAINLNKLWLPLIVFPIAHTFILLFRNINLPAFHVIITIFINLGTILMFFYLYNTLSKVFEDTLKSALHSQEKDYYFSQCRLMQESVESTKSIRHDMQFHLATARDFISNNKSTEAENYLSGLIGDIGKNDIYSSTKNIAFDSIINFKLKNAKQEIIKTDLRLLIPTSLNIEMSDIVIIIGNLLDNALDAVSKVEDRFIKLDIEYSRGSLFIQIENSFDGIVRYSEESDGIESQIVSSKDGADNGFGLKNIMQSVEKYNGYMKISHTEEVFSAGIFLYVNES